MTTRTIAELTADAKLVYNGSMTDLIDLADTYNVTTKSLAYYRQNPPEGRSLVVAALGSKSQVAEMRKALYATIKTQLREAGA